MKKKISFAIALITTTLLISPISFAAESPTKPQEAKVDVHASLTAKLPSLPGAPSFTAKGKGELHYSLHGSSATIKSDSFPKLIFEAEKVPEGIKKLSVIVEGIPGTDLTVHWEHHPEVEVKGDLRLRAYALAAKEITKDSSPIVDIILSDLTLSTKEISVEGFETRGFIDEDRLEAQFVGKALLPDYDYDLYKKNLAGKSALLEFVIGIENAYAEKK